MRAAPATPDRARIYLTADAVGGVWDYTAQLARGLVANGHRVRVAVIGRAAADRLADLPEEAEITGADYRLEWMPGAAADVDAAGEWLAADARRWGADLVHLNQMSYGDRDFGAPTLVVVHSDVLSWFSETRGTDAPPEYGEYAERVRAGLAAADVVAAPSEYQSRLTRAHYGRGADEVIHNGIEARPGDPVNRAGCLVVSAGRAWDEAKGMAIVDEAAGLLGPDGPEVHLLGGTHGPAGQRFVARHAEMHGRLPRGRVDEWLDRSSIYVGASLYEPFGLAPLEAAFRGAALVLSDIASFRELWGGCAVFFPAGDARALAESIRELVADPGRRHELGRAARQRAISRYDADTFTARYLDLYAAMLMQLATKPSCV